MKKFNLCASFALACILFVACGTKEPYQNNTNTSSENTGSEQSSDQSVHEDNTLTDNSENDITTESDNDVSDETLISPDNNAEKESANANISEDSIQIFENDDVRQEDGAITELKYPVTLNKEQTENAEVSYVKVDDDDSPDIIVSIDDSSSMIWLYDETNKEYVYNEELSRVPEQDTDSNATQEYEGMWTNEQMQVEIIKSDSIYTAIITDSSNTSKTTEWLYDCNLSSDTKQLVCEGTANKTVITFNDNGEPLSVSTEYENGSGSFHIDDTGHLHWNNKTENSGQDYIFNKQ